MGKRKPKPAAPMQYGEIEISVELCSIEYVFSSESDGQGSCFVHLRDAFGTPYKFPLRSLPVPFQPGNYRYRISFRETTE